MFNLNAKVFLVISNKDEITVFDTETASISQSIGGPFEICSTSYLRPKKFYRDNEYLPITEEEIANLFITNNIFQE